MSPPFIPSLPRFSARVQGVLDGHAQAKRRDKEAARLFFWLKGALQVMIPPPRPFQVRLPHPLGAHAPPLPPFSRGAAGAQR